MPSSYSKNNWLFDLSLVKTMVYTNAFIALCAFAQVFLTYRLFHIPFNLENKIYLIVVLLSTYLQYNVQRGYYFINQTNLDSERGKWVSKHKNILLLSVIISLVVVLFFINILSFVSILIMSVAELISILYFLPPFNLRRYGYFKPFLISFVWVISCCLVPLIENELFNTHSIWYLASQFVFISVLCMLFDVKEHENDFLTGVKTYANQFGVKVTKIICVCLVLIGFTCFYYFNHTMPYLAPSIMLRLLLLITILLTKDSRHEFYYYLVIDGLLILQAILFFVF